MVTQLSSESQSWRSRLVTELRGSGAITTPAIARAFLSIPRELFVQEFYQHDGKRGWVVCSPASLDAIYQDEALATAINAHNMPVSSSSQPSIMAHMLEVLEVLPGQHVLEVGAGTGYNAALLAELVGDSALVTTIEVDADIAARAAKILHDHIGPVEVRVGDGRIMHGSSQRYDRIIATGSSSFIPCAWYEMLAPGGRLVMPLEGSLQIGSFLVIQKENDHGIGGFRDIPLHFMSLHAEIEDIRPLAILPPELRQLPATANVHIESEDPILPALKGRHFACFLQWAWPQAGELRINPIRMADGQQSLRIVDVAARSLLQLFQQEDCSWSGKLCGKLPLWETIQQWYKRFQEMGQPDQSAYSITLDDEQAMLCVSSADDSQLLLRNLYQSI